MPAALSLASAAVAVRVFPPSAGFVADVCFLPAAFSRHPLFGAPVAGAPDPASVGVFGDPVLAGSKVFPADAGISGPDWDSPCGGG